MRGTTPVCANMTNERVTAVRQTLLAAYRETGLWGVTQPDWPLPETLKRGEDAHLAWLTLVYTVSGGRDPAQLWPAARTAYVARPDLFDPQVLAYARPDTLIEPLRAYRLAQKVKSEATVWQRIGQALVMRAAGSVSQLLAGYDFSAPALWQMLQSNKVTFPVLSGPQTGPRWLYGLAATGGQPLTGAARLPVPPSPPGKKALAALQISGKQVSAEIFAPLDLLGRRGCAQRKPGQTSCPAAGACPVAGFCRYGRSSS